MEQDPVRVPLSAAAVAALAQGNKIEAIKLLRQATKLGLAEAKGIIDALDAAHARGAQSPPKTIHPHAAHHFPGRPGGLSPGEVPRSGGGGAVIAIVAIVAAALGAWLYLK